MVSQNARRDKVARVSLIAGSVTCRDCPGFLGCSGSTRVASLSDGLTSCDGAGPVRESDVPADVR